MKHTKHTSTSNNTYRYRLPSNLEQTILWNFLLWIFINIIYLIVITKFNIEGGYNVVWIIFAVLSVLFWILYLQYPLFYEDHVEFIYPLRPYKRIVRYDYSQFESLSFFPSYLRFYLKEETPRYNWWFAEFHLTKLSSCFLRKSTQTNYIYLCRFLKQKDVAIRAGTEGLDRLELAFGPGDRHIPRMSMAQRKEESWAARFLIILCVILGIAFVIFVRYLMNR